MKLWGFGYPSYQPPCFSVYYRPDNGLLIKKLIVGDKYLVVLYGVGKGRYV